MRAPSEKQGKTGKPTNCMRVPRERRGEICIRVPGGKQEKQENQDTVSAYPERKKKRKKEADCKGIPREKQENQINKLYQGTH